MATLAQICEFLEGHAPVELAEEWDNVGLLVGRREARIERVMTCLTVTPRSAAEAVGQGAELIVSHHPLPFQPLRRITDETTPGRLLLELIAAGIALYSPHTAFDSAALGINQHLALGLGLTQIEPLVSGETTSAGLGSGRQGELPAPASLADVVGQLKSFLGIDSLRAVGDPKQQVQRVAVACGSGGSLLAEAAGAGCQAFISGEANFHTCLEAEARGLGLLLAGHYASERFGVERLAEAIAAEFPELSVWASRDEADPLISL